MIRAIQENTRVSWPGCEMGYEVGFAVLYRMRNTHGVSDYETGAMTFLQELGQRWEVGEVGCDNDVLLLLSAADRRLIIRTQSRSRERLTHSMAARIVTSTEPLLSEGRYDDAVLLCLVKIYECLQNTHTSSRFGGELFSTWLIACCFLRAAFCIGSQRFPSSYLTLRIHWRRSPALFLQNLWRRTVGARLWNLVWETHKFSRQSRCHSQDINPSICPICLESLSGDPSANGVLRCGHCFHRACLGPWLEQSSSCPTCRSGVHALSTWF